MGRLIAMLRSAISLLKRTVVPYDEFLNAIREAGEVDTTAASPEFVRLRLLMGNRVFHGDPIPRGTVITEFIGESNGDRKLKCLIWIRVDDPTAIRVIAAL